jgi:hypothetical protein
VEREEVGGGEGVVLDGWEEGGEGAEREGGEDLEEVCHEDDGGRVCK